MKPATLLLIFVLMLAGCAGPTAYQRVGFAGGFSETQLNDNTYEVYFRGNGFTSGERAKDFLLLRAAEITLDRGFRYFEIFDTEMHLNVNVYNEPVTYDTTAQIHNFGDFGHLQATTKVRGGDTVVSRKPVTSTKIRCFTEKPNGKELVLDAVFISETIRRKYKIT